VPPSDWVREERLKSIYTIDAAIYNKRLSHENKEVQDLYADYLGEPCGALAHKLLHTAFTDRSAHLRAKTKV
jgi:NADH-quinone oxidoreductase subunit G